MNGLASSSGTSHNVDEMNFVPQEIVPKACAERMKGLSLRDGAYVFSMCCQFGRGRDNHPQLQDHVEAVGWSAGLVRMN